MVLFYLFKKIFHIYANSDKPRDIRNNAIIHLFLNCGLRLSELYDKRQTIGKNMIGDNIINIIQPNKEINVG